MSEEQIEFNQPHIDLLRQCYEDIKDDKNFKKDSLYELMLDYFNNVMKEVVAILKDTDNVSKIIFQYHQEQKLDESQFSQHQSRIIIKIYKTIKANLEAMEANADFHKQIKEKGLPPITISLDRPDDPNSVHNIKQQIVGVGVLFYLDKILDILEGLPIAQEFVYHGCQVPKGAEEVDPE